ncbi:MAG: hypothetical protein HY231_19175 [Acidobacteria bacterium]|nr:hypothetical protein [Acidobacteriota bacterium]
MYKCQICGSNSEPNTPAHKIIIAARKATYPFRARANACWKWIKERRKFVHTDDRGGQGVERVREVLACAACAMKFANSANGDNAKTDFRNDGKRRR